jgi:hypothetical protein
MSTQTIQAPVTIEWDDSAVIVFSFLDSNNNQQFCGFVHLGFAQQTGSQTQVNKVLQTAQSIQVSADPQSWVETCKNSHRNQNNKVQITYDDSTSQNYTTVTAQTFQLQLLFSLAG